MPPTGLKTNKATDAPADTDSAKRVLISAMQSSSGITRLTTQAYNAAEQNAVTKLTGASGAIGGHMAALANGALGSALTSASTWGALVTAIGNS